MTDADHPSNAPSANVQIQVFSRSAIFQDLAQAFPVFGIVGHPHRFEFRAEPLLVFVRAASGHESNPCRKWWSRRSLPPSDPLPRSP